MLNKTEETRREARLNEVNGKQLSLRQYNSVLSGTLLYGLVVNFILCVTIGDVTKYVDPLMFLLGYFICAIAGCIIANKSNSLIISLIGYNMLVIPVGLSVSTVITTYGELSSQIVVNAFLISMSITVVMTVLALIKPKFFSKLGGLLFATLVGLLLAEIISLILGYDNILYSWIAAVLFSLYIAYDIYRSQEYPKTLKNAVDSALDIYLDIINLFLNILKILSKNN